MKSSNLIPLIAIPVLGLIFGLGVLPMVEHTKQAELDAKMKFYSEYAFEPNFLAMNPDSRLKFANANFTVKWFIDGQEIDPEYWYQNCIENCSGYHDEIKWRVDRTRPVIVIPSDTDLIQFTIYPHNSNHFIMWQDMEEYNGVIVHSEYIVDYVGSAVFTMNMSHSRDMYHRNAGNILPMTTIFVTMYEAEPLIEVEKVT